MADYKTITSDRDLNSSQVRKRFQLEQETTSAAPAETGIDDPVASV